MAREEVRIEGMSCQHCVARVRSALEALEGVEVRELEIGKASLDVDAERVSRAEVLAAIDAVGYSAS